MAIDPRLERLPEQEGPANRTWRRIMETTFGTVHPVVTPLMAEPRTQAKPDAALDDFIPLDNSPKSSNGKARDRTDISTNTMIKNKRLKSENEVTESNVSESTAPWKCRDSYPENAYGLHLEILDFFKYMSPYSEEEAMRRDVVERMKDLILNIWPTSRVEVFGSFKTNLYLPTSDIDLVVFGNLEKSPLRTLEKVLVGKDIADPSSIKVLDKASVPIVKLTDKVSKVKVDISFNMETAIRGAALIKSFIEEFRVLPYLFLVLKQFLVQRDLNEVFTGGISSYCLMLLTVSFLQRHPRDDVMSPDANIGVLLMEFFELYGRNFNYQRTGIKIKNGGCYISKDEMVKEMSNGEFPSLLCVEDPVTQGTDIGKSSYGIMRIKEAFDHAYLVLDKALRNRHYHQINPNSTYLSRIIQVPEDVLTYRKWVKSMYNPIAPGALPSSPILSPSHVSMTSTTFSHALPPYPGSGASSVPLIPSSPVMAYPPVNGAYPSLGVTVLHPTQGAIILPSCNSGGSPSLLVRPYPLSPLNPIIANTHESCSSPVLLSSDDDAGCGENLSDQINNKLVLCPSRQNTNASRAQLTDSDSSGNESSNLTYKRQVPSTTNSFVFESSRNLCRENSPAHSTSDCKANDGCSADRTIGDVVSSRNDCKSHESPQSPEFVKQPLGRRGSLTITALERVTENFLKDDKFSSSRPFTDSDKSDKLNNDFKDKFSNMDIKTVVSSRNGSKNYESKEESNTYASDSEHCPLVQDKNETGEKSSSSSLSHKQDKVDKRSYYGDHDKSNAMKSSKVQSLTFDNSSKPETGSGKDRYGQSSPGLSRRHKRGSNEGNYRSSHGTTDDSRQSFGHSDHERGLERAYSPKKVGKQNTDRSHKSSVTSPSCGRRQLSERDHKYSHVHDNNSESSSNSYSRNKSWTIELEDHIPFHERGERLSGSLSPRNWRSSGKHHNEASFTPPESPRSPRNHKSGQFSQRRRSKKDGKYSG